MVSRTLKQPSFCFLKAAWLLLIVELVHSADVRVPLQAPTYPRHYGPDGPWQAIIVTLGDPGQDIDLYPAGTKESDVFTKSVCDDIKLAPCGSGGLFDPKSSGTFVDLSSQNALKGGAPGEDYLFTAGGTRFDTHKAGLALEQLHIASWKIENFSIAVINQAAIVTPDGVHQPVQLGRLSLGHDVSEL